MLFLCEAAIFLNEPTGPFMGLLRALAGWEKHHFGTWSSHQQSVNHSRENNWQQHRCSISVLSLCLSMQTGGSADSQLSLKLTAWSQCVLGSVNRPVLTLLILLLNLAGAWKGLSATYWWKAVVDLWRGNWQEMIREAFGWMDEMLSLPLKSNQGHVLHSLLSLSEIKRHLYNDFRNVIAVGHHFWIEIIVSLFWVIQMNMKWKEYDYTWLLVVTSSHILFIKLASGQTCCKVRSY